MSEDFFSAKTYFYLGGFGPVFFNSEGSASLTPNFIINLCYLEGSATLTPNFIINLCYSGGSAPRVFFIRKAPTNPF